MIVGMETFNLIHKDLKNEKGESFKEIVLANNYDSNKKTYAPISETVVQGTTDAR
jgi:hypothetical protein